MACNFACKCTTPLHTILAPFGEIAILLKTESSGDVNIVYYSANNGQYFYLERKKLLSMGAEIVINKVN